MKSILTMFLLILPSSAFVPRLTALSKRYDIHALQAKAVPHIVKNRVGASTNTIKSNAESKSILLDESDPILGLPNDKSSVSDIEQKAALPEATHQSSGISKMLGNSSYITAQINKLSSSVLLILQTKRLLC